MSVQVTLELPAEVEQRLRQEGTDLGAEVKKAYVLDLFRRRKISRQELSRTLGLDRFETDAFLKRHQVFEGSLTPAELEADRRTLERLLREHSNAGDR
jgi:predicted HTH domain antitoxin